jgi:hypothetical protein
MKAAMEGLLLQYQVDLVFAGHVHAYERTAPVANGVVTPGAITYITIGDGGNREGPADQWYSQSRTYTYPRRYMASCEAGSMVFT